MLWNIARSKSTIICKSLSTDPGVKCIYHPFFLVEDPEQLNEIENLIETEVFENSQHVFIKENPSLIDPLAMKKWAEKINNHVLVIRHPKEVALSALKVDGAQTPYFLYNESLLPGNVDKSFKIMEDLKNILEELDQNYIILDASEMTRENGGDFIRVICDLADIPFNPTRMLQMEKLDGEKIPENWWMPPHRSRSSLIMM